MPRITCHYPIAGMAFPSLSPRHQRLLPQTCHRLPHINDQRSRRVRARGRDRGGERWRTCMGSRRFCSPLPHLFLVPRLSCCTGHLCDVHPVHTHTHPLCSQVHVRDSARELTPDASPSPLTAPQTSSPSSLCSTSCTTSSTSTRTRNGEQTQRSAGKITALRRQAHAVIG